MLLEDGRTFKADEPCRKVWSKLLGAQDISVLFERLGKVMALSSQALQEIKDNFEEEAETCSHWKAQVDNAFLNQNLQGPWQTFIGHIDNHTINYLRLSSKLLQTISDVQRISDDRISEIRGKLEKIYEEVMQSGIDEEVKLYVVRYLRKLITALDEYYLTGAVPVLEAVDTMYGHAFVDKKYRSFLTDEDVGRRLLDILSAAASIATVAVGLPPISEGFKLLTGN